MKANTASRLHEVMQEKNLKPVDVLRLCEPYCQEYGVLLEKTHLSKYIKGIVQPKQIRLTILARALDVNEQWLMGFDVPKKRDITTSSVSESDSIHYSDAFKRWQKEVDEVHWSDEELTELINYAKYLISKRR